MHARNCTLFRFRVQFNGIISLTEITSIRNKLRNNNDTVHTTNEYLSGFRKRSFLVREQKPRYFSTKPRETFVLFLAGRNLLDTLYIPALCKSLPHRVFVIMNICERTIDAQTIKVFSYANFLFRYYFLIESSNRVGRSRDFVVSLHRSIIVKIILPNEITKLYPKRMPAKRTSALLWTVFRETLVRKCPALFRNDGKLRQWLIRMLFV